MNRKYDNKIINILIILTIILYMPNFNKLVLLPYTLSILFYLIGIFKLGNTPIFSMMGLYSVYMYIFVQIGVYFQEYFDIYLNYKVIVIIMMYNFIFTIALIVWKKIMYFNKYTYFNTLKLDPISNRILFIIGICIFGVFFFKSGGLILFMNDAENARINAVAGSGFLVVLGTQFLNIATLIEKKEKIRTIYLIISIILMFGTGFRSQALYLIAMYYIIYYINTNKASIAKMFGIVMIISFLYAYIGVVRSGLKNWTLLSLYKPVIWRMFVNTSNFSDVLNLYPESLFTVGKSYINDLLTVLPGPQETYILKLKDILNIQFDGGSLTPSIFGESYYNFGLVGAVVIPILIGIIILTIDYFSRRYLSTEIYLIASFLMVGISTTGIMPVLLYSILPLILVYIVRILIMCILRK